MLLTKPDGVPTYHRGTVPAHLRTYKQLKLAGLRPANARRPDGAWPMHYRTGQQGWVWLYDVAQARSYVCKTKHARQAREKAEV